MRQQNPLIALALVISTAIHVAAYAQQNSASNKSHQADAVGMVPVAESADVSHIDVSFLGESLSDVRILGLGECSHFTRECYTLKHATILQLAKSSGFNTLILEVDFGQALKWNDYVTKGRGELDKLVGETGWFTYRTEEFRALLSDIREFNKGVDSDRQIQIYGMEMTYLKDNLNWLESFLNQLPELNDSVSALLNLKRKVLAFQRHEEREVLEYWKLYYQLRRVLRDNRDALLAKTSQREFATAERTVEIIRQYCTYVAQSDSRFQLELRDHFSAQNVRWVLNQRANSKAIVWAHNGHVRKDYHYDTLGHNLSLVFGDQYFAIGFMFGEGEFGSYDDNWSFKTFSYPAAPAGQLESTLNQKNSDLFLDLAKLAKSPETAALVNGPVTKWRDISEQMRSQTMQSTTEIVLTEAYDGVFFIRKSSTPKAFLRDEPNRP